MSTVIRQIPPSQAFKPELQCADFVELALMPDAVITAELVSASASDRLDDFRVLADIVRASPSMAAYRERWQQAALDLEALLPHERIAIGSSPLCRRWLHATGRALIAGAPLEVFEPLLASVANYIPGFLEVAPRGRVLMSRGGHIETWDCASGIKLPAGYGDGAWQCRRKGAWIHLSPLPASGQTLSSCLVAPDAVLPRSHIVVRNDLPGLRVSLDETRTPERGSAVREKETDARQCSYPQGRHRPIVEAAQALLSAWPEEYKDWRRTMRVVVPRLPPAGWQMEGFTISSMQGAAWIHPSNTLRTLESLVHEHSHVKLRYVEEAVPLLQSVQTDARFPVGWRTDLRPIVGIFEGVYVHLHCVMALVRYLQDTGLDAATRHDAAIRLDELRVQAREGFEILSRHGHFTKAGQGFLRWAESTLRDY
ncbi:aKG-HExxH-type peptide beta-hydroxylase [Polaromonas sp. CT11-55]|uniref:aKG-HExxH-type peptide beta-hydroxylase n=1 Tax=Polaromonas sp. CT11-55 TaxID=3243045 RepID=UPI0039A5A1EC